MPYGYGWLLLDDKNTLHAYSFIIIIAVVIYYYRCHYQCKDYSYIVMKYVSWALYKIISTRLHVMCSV